ncbi:MAG: hypothetical protein ACJ78Q_14245 [Chloroflexia bacterium]
MKFFAWMWLVLGIASGFLVVAMGVVSSSRLPGYPTGSSVQLVPASGVAFLVGLAIIFVAAFSWALLLGLAYMTEFLMEMRDRVVSGDSQW